MGFNPLVVSNPCGGCSVTIFDPANTAVATTDRETLLLEVWFLAKETNPESSFNAHRQTWSHWPAQRLTEEELEQFLLYDWFAWKEALPHLPYNSHTECSRDHSRSLLDVLYLMRLVVDGKARPLYVV